MLTACADTEESAGAGFATFIFAVISRNPGSISRNRSNDGRASRVGMSSESMRCSLAIRYLAVRSGERRGDRGGQGDLVTVYLAIDDRRGEAGGERAAGQ